MDCERCRGRACRAAQRRLRSSPALEESEELPFALLSDPCRRFPLTSVAPLCTSLSHLLRCVLICLNDIDVPGAAAEVSPNRVTDFILAWVGMALQVSKSRHQHTGRTVAALQPMLLE